MPHVAWNTFLFGLPLFPVVAGAALLLGAVAWFNVVRLRRARAALALSLSQDGLAVVSAKLCWVPSGPFSAAIARHQPVYRVIARDAYGRLRHGWIRCIPFSETTETVWQ